MTKTRSLGFIGAALIAASATTAVCFGDALGLVSAQSAPLGASAVPPAPLGATSRPNDVLSKAKPWLTEVPGGRLFVHEESPGEVARALLPFMGRPGIS